MACAICGAIETTARANTGREEYFRDPITRMTSYGLDTSDDFWECPECGSVFAWHDDTALTGSGNNDEQTLTRLAEDEAAAIRALAHSAHAITDAELAGLAADIAATRPVIRELVILLLRRDMKASERLIPHLLDVAARSPGAIELLQRLARTPDEAARVQLSLDQHEGAHLEPLRAHVRTVACSICRDICYYPPLETSRVPTLAAMQPLVEGRGDVRECSECGSLFEVEGTGISRIAAGLAKALGECLRAPEPSPTAFAMVKSCGARWKWVCDRVERQAKQKLQGPPEPEDSLVLRREIARDPGDLSLRQMWAVLAERDGKADRARLVEEQLARRTKQMSSPSYRAFVSTAERELLAAHPEWSDELAPLGASEGVLSGGFVESIVIDASTLLWEGTPLLDCAPVRAVRLTGDVRLVPQLVEAHRLDRVCWVDLSGLSIDAEVLASLATLQGLRALGLAKTGMTDALVETVWTSFPRLLVCNLGSNPCSDLVTQDLTWQEMSRYEWFATDRAARLADAHGSRGWIYPSSSPGEPPVDLEQLLAQIAAGW